MMTAEFMLSKRSVLRFTAALFFLLNAAISLYDTQKDIIVIMTKAAHRNYLATARSCL